MAPAPLCKTAIVTFLVDRETVPKLWNLSSNMRKRMQMVVEQMEIRLEESNEKVFKIKEWIKIGENWDLAESADDLNKGISNYSIKNQEQLDKLISLNSKLRLYTFRFQPKELLEVDYIGYLMVSSENYAYYSQCSFNKGGKICFCGFPSSQIKDASIKFKQFSKITIKDSSISDLDLSDLNFRSFEFSNVTFSGKVKLPSYIDYLGMYDCKNVDSLKCNKVARIYFCRNGVKDSQNLLKSLKGVKEFDMYGKISEYINYLPNTVKKLNRWVEFDSKNIDFSTLKEKFPLLIRVHKKIAIEAAQILNLRSVKPEIKETNEKFAFRPREIRINRWNVEQLNKHPELFEKVEKVDIWTPHFNFDCLPAGIKEMRLGHFTLEGDKIESLEENNWKFENTVINLSFLYDDMLSDESFDPNSKQILNSLGKVKKIKKHNIRMIDPADYPQFSFITY